MPKIKDLLPLYCDDALSDVSKEEVEKHIAECDDCKKTYEYMKNGDIKLDTASNVTVERIPPSVSIKIAFLFAPLVPESETLWSFA